MSDVPIEPMSVEGDAVTVPSSRASFDWSKIVQSPAFWPGVALVVGFALLYLRMLGGLWELWSSGDGYYSHGFLVPLISGYVIYRSWPKLSKIPVKPMTIAIVPILAFAWVAARASYAGINLIMSLCFVGTLLAGAAFLAGWRWMMGLSPSILYLAFAMPFWNSAIDAYTNPLQKLSTKVAFQFLRFTVHTPYMSQTDDTTIFLDNYTLNVAVPCSGLKLVLALGAFVVFFVLIARLRWWGNTILLLSVLPMALIFNGLRIAMIGIVGNAYGEKAGLAFHDYSGYITLLICFFALFKFARALGWKD